MKDSRTARNRFTIATFVVAIVLLAWGAFVTSINAGMAVPDWPTSFDSYDPFNPWPNWWTITPILAEHGHRLLGALIGLLTLTLCIWTWIADPRTWMKSLAVGALILVILQGVLGGLRVLLISIDLAVVHALVAQLFFALLASMIVFTSKTWSTPVNKEAESEYFGRLKGLAIAAPVVIYMQIFLGALLRHPGTGIDPFFVGLHLGWAFVATGFVVVWWSRLRMASVHFRVLRSLASVLLSVLSAQVALGLFAYLVLLDETGTVKASNVQVLANTGHMVIGALLFATAVTCSVFSFRFMHFEKTAKVV